MNLFYLVRRTATAIAGIVTLASVALAPMDAKADYPERPINLVIGFNAGGGTDLTGRALAKELQGILGKPVVVVNKPGAASMIAAKFVADSRADGYTLWYGSVGTMVLKQEMGQFDADLFSDFKIAGTVSRLVPAVAVHMDSPFQTMQDIIDAAKANPGKLRWAHPGVGSAFMAQGVGFIEANGIDVQAVPFSGSAKSRVAIIGGQVDFGIQNQNSRITQGTKMRVLGAFRDTKEQLIDSEVPAMGEIGVNFTPIDSPVGILAPAGVSDEIVAKLSAAIEQAAASDGYKETMNTLLFPVEFETAEQASANAKTIQENVQTILPVLKAQ